jgi:hypothetical protein
MKEINSRIYIEDNFYKDPNEIRYAALQQSLKNHGYHPGMRTPRSFNKEAHDKLVIIMGSEIYPTGDCYSFQFNTENDVSWIHCDTEPYEIIKGYKRERFQWAAVVYLTPDAPIDSGTVLYSDKKYNKRSMRSILFNSSESRSKGEQIIYELSNNGSDKSKWNIETLIGNKYNRIVIYDASYYHQANRYFGKTKENCRLIQVLFFYTERKEMNNI